MKQQIQKIADKLSKYAPNAKLDNKATTIDEDKGVVITNYDDLSDNEHVNIIEFLKKSRSLCDGMAHVCEGDKWITIIFFSTK